MKRFALLVAFLSACTSRSAQTAVHAEPTALHVAEDATLVRHLDAENVSGVIAVLPAGSDTVLCSDARECVMRTAPASTFKIVNALVALETGVAPDADFVIPWDGVTRSFPSWNQDHTLASAFAASSVPYYQELARRIGLPRMREAVARFHYGNAEIGDSVDTFWLGLPLAISPLEQLAFLRDFETGALPITERTCAIMRDVLIRETTRDGSAVLRGKTGWSTDDPAGERGWFVGYATREGRTTYIAVRVTRHESIPDPVFMASRMRIAIATLVAKGAY